MGNKFNKKHGLSSSRLYRIYNNIKSRCNKSYAKEYENYGGRGIKICDEWLGEDGFVNFYNWAVTHGYSDELTIDRIDNDGNYEPENCRWVTHTIQNNNSRHANIVEYNGVNNSISEWARIKGISRGVLVKRLRMGWPVDKALNTPVDKRYSR